MISLLLFESIFRMNTVTPASSVKSSASPKPIASRSDSQSSKPQAKSSRILSLNSSTSSPAKVSPLNYMRCADIFFYHCSIHDSLLFALILLHHYP